MRRCLSGSEDWFGSYRFEMRPRAKKETFRISDESLLRLELFSRFIKNFFLSICYRHVMIEESVLP